MGTFRFKSDLRNHQAIVQPRLYDSLMVTQITLGRKGASHWGGRESGADGSLGRMAGEPGADGSLGRIGVWGGRGYGAEWSLGRRMGALGGPTDRRGFQPALAPNFKKVTPRNHDRLYLRTEPPPGAGASPESEASVVWSWLDGPLGARSVQADGSSRHSWVES